ncbi:MAG: methylated-DNA--[protein]-cysteine S-methyltransferase [Candidatus Lokiarchaeota archaeon]|nr:methylated-DNA--[protein]-cysteine S-methyltransferase [Candidatus Lokiarchaeota archaeon]
MKIEPLNIYLLISWKKSNSKKKSIILERITLHNEKNKVLNKNNRKNMDSLNKDLQEHQEIVEKLLKIIQSYFKGKKLNLADAIKFLDLDLDLENKFTSSFSLKVAKALLSINYGELVSYSTLGEMIGSRAFRAIGTVLKSNPLPLIIPCHRVVRKNGDLGGFMGEARGGWQQDLKKGLIFLERNCKSI